MMSAGDDAAVEAAMRASFDEVDSDNNGRISIVQMGQVLHQMARQQPVPESIIRDIMSTADKDNSGAITFDEFKDAVMGMTNIVFIIIVNDVQPRFEKYDVDNSGKLNRVELQAFVDSLPDHRKPVNVQEIIDTCDKNKDGEIDFDEFVRMILAEQAKDY